MIMEKIAPDVSARSKRADRDTLSDRISDAEGTTHDLETLLQAIEHMFDEIRGWSRGNDQVAFWLGHAERLQRMAKHRAAELETILEAVQKAL